MKQATTLTVNPGHKTVGALHHSARANGIARDANVYDKALELTGLRQSGAVRDQLLEHERYLYHKNAYRSYQRRLKALNLCIPTRRAGFGMSLVMFAFRVGFAVVLITKALAPALQGTFAGVAMIVAGVLIGLGIMSRFISAITAVAFIALSILGGAGIGIEMTILLAAVSVIVCVIGPGWFSVDAIVRVKIVRKLAAERRRLQQMML